VGEDKETFALEFLIWMKGSVFYNTIISSLSAAEVEFMNSRK
jgi:hypothetical protein